MKEESKINYENECPICLEYVDDNTGFIKMDCCNKNVHINCLINWHNTNTSDVCFMCKQENKFCKELSTESISRNRQTEENSIIELQSTANNLQNIIIIDDSSISDSSIRNTQTQNNSNCNSHKCCPPQKRARQGYVCCICSVIIIVLFVLLI